MVVPGKSYDEYNAVEGVTSSLLRLVHKEPLSTVKAVMDGRVKIEGDALDFGKAMHALVLEDKEEFEVQPLKYLGPNGDQKDWHNGAQFCKAWYAEREGKLVMTAAEVKALRGMAEAIRTNEELNPYLAGQPELSIFVEREKGQKLKARLDLLPSLPGAPILDFKKTRSAEPSRFTRQLFDLGYHLQAAFYIDVLKLAGIERKEFWFVAIEDFEPYNISIAKLKDVPISFIALGRMEYRMAYGKLLNARSQDAWPTYGSFEPEQHTTAWMNQAIERTA